MPKFRVTISGLGKDFVRTQASIIKDLSDRQIEAIAKETEQVIQQKIRERIERAGSTDNLAKSFFAIPITNGWGVGDVDYLNTHANYWYWQNFGVAQSGRTIPPRRKGEFRPGEPQPMGGQGGSRWYNDSNGKYLINPQKEIEAKNYIQATINEVNQIIASVMRRITL